MLLSSPQPPTSPFHLRIGHSGTSLVVQWLRLWAHNAGGPGSIPGQGTGSHMLQWRSPVPQLTSDAAKSIKKEKKRSRHEGSWSLANFPFPFVPFV